jgi:integrase
VLKSRWPESPLLHKRVIVSNNWRCPDPRPHHRLPHPDETGSRLFTQLADHPRNKAVCLIANRHALRASEVGLLRIEDVDFERLRIMLHRLKPSYSGEDPMQPDEAKTLKAYLRERIIESPILFTSNRTIRSPAHAGLADEDVRGARRTPFG